MSCTGGGVANLVPAIPSSRPAAEPAAVVPELGSFFEGAAGDTNGVSPITATAVHGSHDPDVDGGALLSERRAPAPDAAPFVVGTEHCSVGGDLGPAVFDEVFLAVGLENVTDKPVGFRSIAGNADNDSAIVALAESRGYKLRRRVVDASELVLVDDDTWLQPAAVVDWEKLRAAGRRSGYTLWALSGYRSWDRQLEIFSSRISDWDDIEAVGEKMEFVAPPGYSKHQSGYALDVSKHQHWLPRESDVYDWMAENRWKVLLDNGWVPSYPEGVENQGPMPEPWEIVWVGTNITEFLRVEAAQFCSRVAAPIGVL